MIMIKPHFWSKFVPFGPSSSPKNIFFPKIWLCQSLDIKKTNAPILKRPSDGRTDRQTDGQTDRQVKVISRDAVRLKMQVTRTKCS